MLREAGWPGEQERESHPEFGSADADMSERPMLAAQTADARSRVAQIYSKWPAGHVRALVLSMHGP